MTQQTIGPDLSTAQRPLFVGKTSAGGRVSWKLGVGRPFLVYRLEGGPKVYVDNRTRQKRITYEAWSSHEDKGYEEASRLIREVDAILFPPEKVVHGFRGWAGNVFIDNVEREVEHYHLPDQNTEEHRFLATYLFTYIQTQT